MPLATAQTPAASSPVAGQLAYIRTESLSVHRNGVQGSCSADSHILASYVVKPIEFIFGHAFRY